MGLSRRMIAFDLQLFLKTCLSAVQSGAVIRKENMNRFAILLGKPEEVTWRHWV